MWSLSISEQTVLQSVYTKLYIENYRMNDT